MAMNGLNRFNDNFSSGDQLGIYDVRENHSCFHRGMAARILQGVNACATLSDS
jgi:hypothetical protein